MMNLRYKRERNILKKMYFKKEASKIAQYEKNICNSCDLNLVVSELDASRLKEIAGDVKVSVIPNGVDLEYFRTRKLDSKNTRGIIFAGGMAYYANREAALFFVSDIWPLLKKYPQKIPVTFIGKNPPKALTDIANGEDVNVPGFVDDVRPYFDRSKIYICPIKNGGGTRLKIIDALAMSKPLIATGMAVEGLDLVEGEHYLRAETGEYFVRRIEQLEGDDNLCRKLASAGRKYVEQNYSWDIIGEKMRQEYNNLIKK
jgi:glycosyltransferase involved in cell wall biosynthesis